MWETTREVRINSYVYGPLYTEGQVLDDQLEPIYNSSVRTLDVAWKTYRKWCTIETNGESGAGISALAARHDDNDGFDIMSGDCITFEIWIQ